MSVIQIHNFSVDRHWPRRPPSANGKDLNTTLDDKDTSDIQQVSDISRYSGSPNQSKLLKVTFNTHNTQGNI